MRKIRLLLAPFSWLYGGVLHIRHFLYDKGILQSSRPAVPTIVVGNLALGGTGKTPLVELVLELLKEKGTIAMLSRGYGRSGNECREVGLEDDPSLTGDEPLQVKQKFPRVRVFVGADRIAAIQQIQERVPEVKVVVLDDALQHRRLDAHLNILLTTWSRPYTKDLLLPAGDRRDVISRARAAQMIVVTKCPSLPDPNERAQWRQRLGLSEHQELFFSGIRYKAPASLDGRPLGTLAGAENILLITGIADPQPLVEYLQPRAKELQHMAFPDHHAFTPADLHRVAQRFDKFAPNPKVLVITEKDAVRLRPLIADGPLKDIPIAVIGMRTVLFDQHERFGALIEHHAGTDKTDRSISEEQNGGKP